MKTMIWIGLLMCGPLIIFANEDQQQLRKKTDWNEHFDQRLSVLEQRLESDLRNMQENQLMLTGEMRRMNDKLESRFDKYFLWGYGTLMVVISTLVSVLFNKQKMKQKKDV